MLLLRRMLLLLLLRRRMLLLHLMVLLRRRRLLLVLLLVVRVLLLPVGRGRMVVRSGRRRLDRRGRPPAVWLPLPRVLPRVLTGSRRKVRRRCVGVSRRRHDVIVATRRKRLRRGALLLLKVRRRRRRLVKRWGCARRRHAGWCLACPATSSSLQNREKSGNVRVLTPPY